MRYAFKRSRSDYFDSIGSAARFSLLMALIVGIAGVALFRVQNLSAELSPFSLALITVIILAILVLRSPDWIILPIFITTSTIFGYGSLPSKLIWRVFGVSNVFETQDVMLFAALIFALWEYLALPKEQRPKLSLLAIPMGFFGFLVLFMSVRSVILQETLWDDVFPDARGLLFLLLYFPIVMMLHTRQRARSFLLALLATALVCVLYNVYLYATPAGTEAYSYIFGLSNTAERGVGVGTAVRLPNLIFMVGSALVCFGIYGYSQDTKQRRLFLALTILSLIAVMVNKGRNAYFGCIMGMGLIWLFVPWQTKWRTALHFSLLALVLAPLLMFSPTIGKNVGGVLSETAIRMSQTFDDREYASGGGVHDRIVEIQMALPHFLKEPILGYGYGKAYGVYVVGRGGMASIQSYTFTHNSWMWHALKGGIVQLAAILLLVAAWIWNTINFLKKAKTNIERGVCWGVLAFIMATLLGSMVQGNFYLMQYLATIAIGMALPELVARYMRMQAEFDAQRQQAALGDTGV